MCFPDVSSPSRRRSSASLEFELVQHSWRIQLNMCGTTRASFGIMSWTVQQKWHRCRTADCPRRRRRRRSPVPMTSSNTLGIVLWGGVARDLQLNLDHAWKVVLYMPISEAVEGRGLSRCNEEERGEGMGRAPQKGTQTNARKRANTDTRRNAKSKSYTPFAHPVLRQNNMVKERKLWRNLAFWGFSTNSKFTPPSNIRRFDHPTPVSNFSRLGWAGEQWVNMSTWTRALSFPQQDKHMSALPSHVHAKQFLENYFLREHMRGLYSHSREYRKIYFIDSAGH